MYGEKQFGTSTVTSRSLSCSDNSGLSNMKQGNNGYNEAATSQQEKRFGTSTVTSRSLSCFDNSQLSNMKRRNDGYNEAATSQQKKEDQFLGSDERWEDIDIILNDSNPLLPVQNVENFNIQGNCYECKQLLRMQAASNLTLKDIKQRLMRLENIIQGRALNPLDNDDNLIAELLPLATVNNINELESILTTSNEAVTQFKRFLLKIGGNNPRNNIHRILKKIFTNECATHCSWKGVRKNFRVDNLQLMLIMRKEITSHHTALTESQFDSITAEWFCFAKQRKTREDNLRLASVGRQENNKENENEGN
ncbi:uncharacterized protein LOC105840871 isoform X2 [Monomorium pharaonis]|uniref:uncharacterized protein LOC105840871 isoform X2 n=1 Tax=Monomorium pharaonis TaxID=307658 RepID=UPI0017470969|nr:uncharacterized protein LOC105840871 isoform X2 [Monomorium pharaonis]